MLMHNVSVVPNIASFFRPRRRSPQGLGVPHPSAVGAINVATAKHTAAFRNALRTLRDKLPHDLDIPPVEGCRLVSLTPSGNMEIRLITDLASVPLWSLTAIVAHEVRVRAPQVTPRAEDVFFMHDLSERRGITHIPNTVRSWVDSGNFAGIYDGLNAQECIKLIAHYRRLRGSVPHLEAVCPHLERATRELLQARLGAVRRPKQVI